MGGHWTLTSCVQKRYLDWVDNGHVVFIIGLRDGLRGCVQNSSDGWVEQAAFRRGLRGGLRGCVQNRSYGWVNLNRLCSKEVGHREWVNKLLVFRKGLRGGLAGCVQKRSPGRVGRLCSEEVSGVGWQVVFRKGLRGGLAGCVQKRSRGRVGRLCSEQV
jgi:hypothetical protein